MAPATYAAAPPLLESRTSRARRAAAWFSSATRLPRPKARSFMRLAPNVLVSITSAPARRYWRCTSRTMSGSLSVNDSKQRLMNTPLPYSIVPIAPSQTSTRSDNAERNGFNMRDGTE